jgi:hypothetical protein
VSYGVRLAGIATFTRIEGRNIGWKTGFGKLHTFKVLHILLYVLFS